jgi:CrcB protein
MINSIFLVGIGGAIGSVLRYGVATFSTIFLPASFPFATIFVNISGSFLIGLCAAWLVTLGHVSNDVKLFFVTGVLGGFTTFSAFSLDVLSLYEKGEIMFAAAYLALSVILSIAAVFLGIYLGRYFIS